MSFYGYSFDENENPEGNYASEEDAVGAATLIVSAEEDKPCFYISLLHEAELSWNTSADDIVDEILDNLAESTGVDIASINVSNDAIKELDTMLADTINRWLKDKKINDNYQLISWTKRYVYAPERHKYIEDIDFSTNF